MDVIVLELTILLGLSERSISVLHDAWVARLLESMVVDHVVQRRVGTVFDDCLGVFHAHGEGIVDLFGAHVLKISIKVNFKENIYATYKWVNAGRDRARWGNDPSEVDAVVGELGSEETVHGVIER